jgi:hypothetical protein
MSMVYIGMVCISIGNGMVCIGNINGMILYGMLWYGMHCKWKWNWYGMVCIYVPFPCMVCIENGMVWYNMHWHWKWKWKWYFMVWYGMVCIGIVNGNAYYTIPFPFPFLMSMHTIPYHCQCIPYKTMVRQFIPYQCIPFPFQRKWQGKLPFPMHTIPYHTITLPMHTIQSIQLYLFP